MVIYKFKGDWENLHPKLIPYRAYVVESMEYFDNINFHHTPREENQVKDTLERLSSMYQVRFHNQAPLIRMDQKDEPTHC